MKVYTLCVPCRSGYGACRCADTNPRCCTCGAQCWPVGSRCDCGGVGIIPHYRAPNGDDELPF